MSCKGLYKILNVYLKFQAHRKNKAKRTIGIDVERHINRLRIGKNMKESELLAILKDFIKYINTEEELLEVSISFFGIDENSF